MPYNPIIKYTAHNKTHKYPYPRNTIRWVHDEMITSPTAAPAQKSWQAVHCIFHHETVGCCFFLIFHSVAKQQVFNFHLVRRAPYSFIINTTTLQIKSMHISFVFPRWEEKKKRRTRSFNSSGSFGTNVLIEFRFASCLLLGNIICWFQVRCIRVIGYAVWNSYECSQQHYSKGNLYVEVGR